VDGTTDRMRDKTMESTTFRPERTEDTGLSGAIDKILDKGLVINADITIDVAGVELLESK